MTTGRPPAEPDDEPVLPEQTRDDTDRAWGERPAEEREDDDRFLRERPPHWE